MINSKQVIYIVRHYFPLFKHAKIRQLLETAPKIRQLLLLEMSPIITKIRQMLRQNQKSQKSCSCLRRHHKFYHINGHLGYTSVLTVVFACEPSQGCDKHSSPQAWSTAETASAEQSRNWTHGCRCDALDWVNWMIPGGGEGRRAAWACGDGGQRLDEEVFPTDGSRRRKP